MPDGRFETWMVVRPDPKIPGGWRVVGGGGLTEKQAREIAGWRGPDYEAMSQSRLYDLRKKAMGLV